MPEGFMPSSVVAGNGGGAELRDCFELFELDLGEEW